MWAWSAPSTATAEPRTPLAAQLPTVEGMSGNTAR